MPDLKTDLTGTRVPIRVLGVDAGMMAISTRRQFPDDEHYDWICDKLSETYGGDRGFVNNDLAVSSSGVGDGGYQLVHVVGDDGVVRGVEVIFLTPAVDAEVERRAAAGGIVEPLDLKKLWDPEAHPDEKEKASRAYDRYRDQINEIDRAVFDEMLPAYLPEGEGHVLGQLECRFGHVSAGDPCYGGATYVGELPKGKYEAVVHVVDLGDWGKRVARLGIYRVSAHG